MSPRLPDERSPWRCGYCGHRTPDLHLTNYSGVPPHVRDAAARVGVVVPAALVCDDAVACMDRMIEAARSS